MERPTFSPFWHRVRVLKPRLRPHVDVTRQHYRGRRWHVAHDPTSNHFYRLTPVAYDLVSMLDGTRDVESAWKLSLAKFGDGAPTQGEVIELLGQLYNSNLLSTDASPETEQLLRRGRERTARRIQGQAIGLMYLRLRILNPDPILSALEPIFRPVLNRWGLAAWCAVVLAALFSLLPEWRRLTGHFDEFISPSNFGFMLATYVCLKIWHELGHGIICKRLGGQVPEAGVMLLVLLPSPFVDASSAWAFRNKWQRMAVGAGGMMFELAAAAVAAFVWLATPDGSLAKQLAYYVMVTSGVSTVIFNINPLMRFDGYFILADLLETPNLQQRAQQMLNALFQRHVLRLKNASFPSSLPGERALLVAYGILSLLYRVFLFFGITLFVLGQWFGVGLALALWTGAMWFILPVAKFVRWLASGSMLSDHRARTIAICSALIAATLILVGLVPLPDWRRAAGVVQSTSRIGVFFETEGFIREVTVRSGDRVAAGQVLARLDNPELERQLVTTIAQIDEVRVIRRQAWAQEATPNAQLADRQLALLSDQLVELERRRAALVVKSPVDGVVVGADPVLAVGAYAKRGIGLCEILEPRRLRVAATLPQSEGAWFRELPRDQYTVEMRTASNPWRVVTGTSVSSPQAAQRELPHAALGYLGGGQVEIDRQDENRAGRMAKQPQFTLYVTVDHPPASASAPSTDAASPADATLGAPGERVYLRFTLPSRPLVTQLVDRFVKLIQGRVNL